MSWVEAWWSEWPEIGAGFETGNKQRHRDETEQTEVWTRAPSVTQDARVSNSPSRGRHSVRERGRWGGGVWTARGQSAFPPLSTGPVFQRSLPPPQITPESALDQDVFLMILSQSFRYFKGILIFLQIYSIFYLLLLSVYIIPTVRRTVFWHNSKQLKLFCAVMKNYAWNWSSSYGKKYQKWWWFSC